MGFLGTAALMRRHLLAVIVMLMLAAGVAYDIKSTPPTYSESASVAFTVTKFLAWPNVPATVRKPLIATEVMMTQALMTRPARQQVSAAGGTAQLQFSPFNTYNLQFPDYAEPIATVTATSPSRAEVQRTLRVAVRLLQGRLAALQAQAGVPASDRIRASLVADTGPLAQPGSPARVFAGLALLTVVALFMVTSFLDRR
jgi:hypothetical protein